MYALIEYVETDWNQTPAEIKRIYLCEFRDYGGPRSLVATIAG